MNHELWTDKHRPTTLTQLKGHTDALKKSMAWINTYSTTHPERKIPLLSGPPGTGKTLMAKTLALSSNIDFVEINCSASREFQELKELINPFVAFTGIDNAKVLIILDELDGQKKDSAFWEFLSRCMRINVNPIIATCNEAYRLPKDFVEKQCILLKFRRQTDSAIRNILFDISIKEGFKLTTNELDTIIVKGDVRASINALQIYCMSGFIIPQTERDRNKWIDTKDILVKKTTIRTIPNMKKYVEELLAYVEENGSFKVTGIDRYNFYEIINQVSYLINTFRIDDAKKLLGMISYSMTYPQPELDEETRYEKTQSPSYITKMYFTKHLRATIESLSLKMCKDYFTSSKDFYEHIFPILQYKSAMDLSFARRLAIQYSLEPSEIAILLDTTVSDPRINKILIPDKALTKPLTAPEREIQSNLEMFA